MAQNELQLIHKELTAIKDELRFIKQHMVDVDTVMTKEDLKAIEEARKEKKLGKLTSLETVKKELGL